jgi:hypothetical protein
MDVHIYIPHADFDSFGYMPRGSTSGMILFAWFLDFMRHLLIYFYNGHINLYSHQCVQEFHLCTTLLIISLMITILTGVSWNLNVVLICISLMTKDAENFLLYLLVIYMSSLENCLFNSFVYLLSGLFFWCLYFEFIIYSEY